MSTQAYKMMIEEELLIISHMSAIFLSCSSTCWISVKSKLAKWINFYIILTTLFGGLERVPIINPPFADISPLFPSPGIDISTMSSYRERAESKRGG